MRRLITDYRDQLEAYATLIVLGVPQARRVWLGVHFVNDAAMEWAPPVSAEEVRQEALPRLLELVEQAARAVLPMAPRPGPYCTWCSYRALCPAMRNVPVPEPVIADLPVEVEAPLPEEGED
jgi:CRISPR/Cas system-associated exonuclease Cas4 (RecB family)